ncbi:chaperone NapD [Diaphorobacter aerolatus]|uniref:Chaperone NapD n=1 Tax=Diaphorobacter aerolatus TaxID=1288495 RepID=A0A7H0GPX8_9BURK|nr:chaperone NapD [Diaphorobacter aerolatus]
MHITSLVVHVVPDQLSAVVNRLSEVGDLQVHGTHPSGKLVVTLEAPRAGVILDRVAQIQQIPGVINASLVYQHADSRQSFDIGASHD